MSTRLSIQCDLNPLLQVHALGNTRCLTRTDAKDFLPGAPRIDLSQAGLLDHLRSMHSVVELDRLAPYLSWITTPDPRHICALHHNVAKGRKIVATCNSRLHLLWYRDHIFVQAIAPYLLSSAWWEYIQDAEPRVFRSAAGFMRSYSLLIRHEMDFQLALKSGLIPDQGVEFEDFVRYIDQFHGIDDSMVANRYHFGEMRLGSINHLTRIFLRKWSYFDTQWSLQDTIGAVITPLITMFAVLSLALNCMQVVLAVPDSETWPAFLDMSKWFPVVVLLLVAAMLAGVAVAVVILRVKEQMFAASVKKTRKREPFLARKMSSVVVGC